MRILGQMLIGGGFLAAGFYVGTQVFTNPLVAALLAAAIIAAAIAIGVKPRKRTRRDAPGLITVDA